MGRRAVYSLDAVVAAGTGEQRQEEEAGGLLRSSASAPAGACAGLPGTPEDQ